MPSRRPSILQSNGIALAIRHVYHAVRDSLARELAERKRNLYHDLSDAEIEFEALLAAECARKAATNAIGSAYQVGAGTSFLQEWPSETARVEVIECLRAAIERYPERFQLDPRELDSHLRLAGLRTKEFVSLHVKEAFELGKTKSGA